jgi:hypothetical protein
MGPLEEKLKKELSPDGCIVACRFPFKTWNPSKEINAGIDSVWFYQHSSADSVPRNEKER